MVLSEESFLPDAEDCAETWRALRWPAGPRCVRCGSSNVAVQDWDYLSSLRRYECRECGRYPPRKVNADDQLVVCFDVSKEKLDGYAIDVRSGAADREITVSIDRKADQIEEKLRELSDYADEHGLEGLCVVCEPTGG